MRRYSGHLTRANALQIANMERILGAAIARVLALELAVGLLLGLGLFQRQASWALLASSALSAGAAGRAAGSFVAASARTAHQKGV